MHRYEIWLTDDQGNRLSDRFGRTLFNNIHSLTYSIVANRIGYFEMVVPARFDTSLIQPDRMVQVWRAPPSARLKLMRVYFIRRRRFETIDGEEVITIAGPDSNELLRRRIVAAYAGSQEADKIDFADDMMKEIVSESLLDTALPVPTAGTRALARLTVAGNITAGPALHWQHAWGYLLLPSGGGVIANIADESREAGTEVFFDIAPASVTPGGIAFEFRTKTGQPGIDRTPLGVMFSEERGNLQDPYLDEDWTEEKNYIYAGGQGQGPSRNVQQVYDAARYNLSIWGRCEGFADARSRTTNNGVRESGRSALREGRPVRIFGGQPLDTSSARFGRDWNFGDTVRVRFKDMEYDTIIRAMAVTVAQEGEEVIDARLEYQEWD